MFLCKRLVHFEYFGGGGQGPKSSVQAQRTGANDRHFSRKTASECLHDVSLLIMTLSVVSSFRMQATIATLKSFSRCRSLTFFLIGDERICARTFHRQLRQRKHSRATETRMNSFRSSLPSCLEVYTPLSHLMMQSICERSDRSFGIVLPAQLYWQSVCPLFQSHPPKVG